MVSSIFSRWFSLGLYVSGTASPLEDPENLIIESLDAIDEEPRLLSMVATWLSCYHKLLISKKMKFKHEKSQRIFLALLEKSGSRDSRWKSLSQLQTQETQQPVFSCLSKPEIDRARKDPDLEFLSQGLILKKHDLIREKILIPPKTTLLRSVILRNRLLHGASVRTDVLSLLPLSQPSSINALAKTLHVQASGVHRIITELLEYGLVEWQGVGPRAKIKWIGI